jgi:hypothetical protein
MPAYKPIGSEITLTTADTVNSATCVRLLETGGTAVSAITVKDSDGNTIGSITLAKSGELVVRKGSTDTVEASGGTVKAASVGFFN